MIPEAGQEWNDGLDPGCYWWIYDVRHAHVYAVFFAADNEPTERRIIWPANRWRAFVEKQGLTLRESSVLSGGASERPCGQNA